MQIFLLVLGLAAAADLSPVTRVVELMQGLSDKVRQDGKNEQDLYDKFKCWCTKVTKAKTTTIATSGSRIKELAAYIDDLESGRVELTSERGEYEKQIKGLEASISEEKTMRDKEHEDFLAAEDEMKKAVAALESAVSVLGDATSDSQALAVMQQKLKQVMVVGQGFLAKPDLSALSKVLDVPDVDWNKLNKDATHKQKYTARSGNIQNILGDMLTTFSDNLSEAQAAEEKAGSDYDTLSSAKKDELDEAKNALREKSGEKGARGVALTESKTEKEDLEKRVEDDTKFLGDTTTACDEKAGQWSARKQLRAEELAAIAEAIGILSADDARDTFRSSMSFVQLVDKKRTIKYNSALAMLRKLSGKDVRLASLLVLLKDDGDDINEEDPFKQVIQMIDDMIVTLEDEEKSDLKTKEECEAERSTKAQEAKKVSKEVDTNTETIDRLTAEIASANATIKAIDEEVADLETEMRDAADQRANEAREFGLAKADDEKAAELITNAIGALGKFYDQQNFVQIRRTRQEPFVAAGEAPTPPPATDFGGPATGESQGVIAMLEMIKADIEKDAAKAQKDEDESIERHGKFEEDSRSTLETLAGSKSDAEERIAGALSDKSDEETTQNTNKEELAKILEYLNKIAVGCDFMAVNFNVRLTNRQAETDGLKKAKAILMGAGTK